MKFSIEPDRFSKLLKQVLLYKSKPLIDSVMATFTPKMLEVMDMSLEVIAVTCLYQPKFFISYSCEKDLEKVMFTKSVLDGLSLGFGGEKIDVETKENKLIIKGRNETYSESLLELIEKPFPLKMELKPNGFLPQKFEPIVTVPVDAKVLQSLPSAEKYIFVADEEKLMVEISDTGTYQKQIEPQGQNYKLGNLRVMFDGEFLQTVFNNLFDGVTYLNLGEEAINISQCKKDCLIAYTLSCLTV